MIVTYSALEYLRQTHAKIMKQFFKKLNHIKVHELKQRNFTDDSSTYFLEVICELRL